jgi:hypothetical protein
MLTDYLLADRLIIPKQQFLYHSLNGIFGGDGIGACVAPLPGCLHCLLKSGDEDLALTSVIAGQDYIIEIEGFL